MSTIEQQGFGMAALGRYCVVVWLSVILLSCKPAEPTAPPVDFVVKSDSGEFSLAQNRGNIVYVDFWATWCGPCRDSFPWMREMHNKYEKDGLKIIALSLDTDHDMAMRFATELSANFEIGFDDTGKIADLFKVKGMPTSILIGRDGRVISKHEGFNDGKKAGYEASIAKALES